MIAAVLVWLVFIATGLLLGYAYTTPEAVSL